MVRKGRGPAAATLLAGLVLGIGTATATAQEFAPVDRPGPPLRPTPQEIDTSLRCTSDVEGARRDPVLLLAGTTVNTDENFSWNHVRALKAIGVPVCTSDLPAPLDDNMGDLQLRGEYVAGAIREVHRRSGRRVALYGHSQGGMIGRWALRWWPDVRGMVSDVVGAAPDNHGTDVALPLCAIPCAVAFWQQRSDARFVAALNSGQETFAGVDYTAIYTRNDEVVVPPTSAVLSGPGRVTNVAVQEICPANGSEHLVVGTTDAVAWALLRDALDHDGPAVVSRIDRGVCEELFMPGVDRATALTELAAAGTALATTIARTPVVTGEPALQCYTLASCALPAATGAPATARTCTSNRRFTIRAPRGLRAVRVTVAGKAVRVSRRAGRARAVVDLRGRRAGTVTVRVRGRDARGRPVTQTRRYRTCTVRR